MSQEVILQFETDDSGLNLTGTVNFPNTVNLNGMTNLSIKGLGEWRHVPANILHLSQGFIESFTMKDQSKKLSKIGMNWIGIKANSDILLSYAIRAGKNGTTKVQDQLTKFFKAIGASSVKFSILDTARELAQQDSM